MTTHPALAPWGWDVALDALPDDLLSMTVAKHKTALKTMKYNHKRQEQ